MNDGEANPILLRLQAPLAIAGLSAAGYWLAHTYEAAYLSVFGLPEALAHVALTTVISAIGSLASGALGAFALALVVNLGLSRYAQRTPTPWTKLSVYMLSWFVFVGSLHVILFRRWWRQWLPVVSISVIFGVMAVVFIWDERRRQTKGLSPEAPPPNLLGSVVPYVGAEVVVLLTLLFQANSVARSVGRAQAMGQEQFLTVTQPAEYVVLRAYDDLLIAARLDRKSKTVGPEIALITPSKVHAMELRLESLGPLRRAEVPPKAAPETASTGSATISPPSPHAPSAPSAEASKPSGSVTGDQSREHSPGTESGTQSGQNSSTTDKPR